MVRLVSSIKYYKAKKVLLCHPAISLLCIYLVELKTVSTRQLAQECFYRLDLWTPNLEAIKLSYTRWTEKQPAIHPYNAIRFGNKHSWDTGAHSWLSQLSIQLLILAQVMISGAWYPAPIQTGSLLSVEAVEDSFSLFLSPSPHTFTLSLKQNLKGY